MRWLGLAFSVLGSMLTIWGAVILYRNSPPDLGAFGGAAIHPDLRNMFTFDPGVEQEFADRDIRTNRNRKGFGLIVAGSILQLAGTIVSAFG